MSSLVLMPRGVRGPRFVRIVLTPLSPRIATLAAVGVVLLLPHLGPSLNGPRVAFGYTPVARDCPAQPVQTARGLAAELSADRFGLAGRRSAATAACPEHRTDRRPA